MDEDEIKRFTKALEAGNYNVAPKELREGCLTLVSCDGRELTEEDYDAAWRQIDAERALRKK